MITLKCKGCKKRATGEKDCHSTCKNYIAWKKEQEIIKAKIRQEQERHRIGKLVDSLTFRR